MPTPTNATVLNYPTSEIEFACVRVTIASPKLRQYTASTEIHLDQRKYDDLVEAERLCKRLSELKPGTEEHRACMLNLERANDRARIIREQISLDIAWSLCRFIGSET